MREIKFSFMYQHQETGRWCDKHKDLKDIAQNGYPNDMDRYSLIVQRQYTGLKDSKGVEIYEGDIVKDQRGSLKSISEVKYSEENARFTFNGWGLPSYIDKWVEVIGNIYENPELLK